ncbi:DUF6473 family protein [Roseovarius phycicola]|uniref:DUF6473 family protein n=1 Tax=Roseovarius phycicola TaxID=3080976 RepID=A0ABZ2HG77_9RHOB
MSVHSLEHRGTAYATCQYPGSKLTFRGPPQNLRRDFIACLGGTETFGRFVSYPFPQLLENSLGIPCVNLGWPNVGIDVLLRDKVLLDVAHRAQAVVLQVPCAVNMSNQFYKVHPRRNDRFLKAEDPLKILFPEVDFTEFNFTRHLLEHLQHVSAERFVQVHAELASCWVDGMQTFLDLLDSPVVLFWFSDRKPETYSNEPGIHYDPALVTRAMLDAVRPHVADLIEYEIAESAHADKIDVAQRDPVLSSDELQVARELPGQRAHKKAAGYLLPAVNAALNA